MIIEFSRDKEEGSLLLAGRAASLWIGEDAEEITRRINRSQISLRPPSGWERDFFLPAFSQPASAVGPPLLGEESTLWSWSEDHPHFLEIETDEPEERKRLGEYPWAEEILRTYRSDSLTIKFRIPAPLFGIEMVLIESS